MSRDSECRRKRLESKIVARRAGSEKTRKVLRSEGKVWRPKGTSRDDSADFEKCELMDASAKRERRARNQIL